MKEAFLEKAVKGTIFGVAAYVLFMILNFDVFQKETIATIIMVLVLIGLGDVVDAIIKLYALIVNYIDKKNK
jgi:hypothetical protein